MSNAIFCQNHSFILWSGVLAVPYLSEVDIQLACNTTCMVVHSGGPHSKKALHNDAYS